MSGWPSFILLLACSSIFDIVSGNWDEATGHLKDYKPSDEWLSKNPPRVCTSEIQVSECARNTRLPFPDVQLFSTFKVNHADDFFHGCPYGLCCAYTFLPSPEDMVPDFTNWHSFFWHNLGGMRGTGTNPISDSQTGRWGYETSDGKLHHGSPDYSRRENGHDSHYPGFKLPEAWPQIHYPSSLGEQPGHPKCGTQDGPNHDPGQINGPYKPAPALSYLPPPRLRLSKRDKRSRF